MELLSWLLPTLVLVILLIIILVIVEKKYNGPPTTLTHSMEGKIVIITGGNSGIGWETALDLLINKATVIIGARNEAQTLAKIRSINSQSISQRAKFIELNLISIESIDSFVDEFKQSYGTFDILINNAGICQQYSEFEHGIEKTFMTNHIGHVLLTNKLLPLINPKGRVIALSTIKYQKINQVTFDLFVQQKTYNLSETIRNFSWMTLYIVSKLANILYMKHLSKINNKTEFKAVAVHPGYINNGFFSHINTCYWKIRLFFQAPYRWLMFKSNKMGAQTTLNACYMDYEDLSNGGFYKDCQEVHLTPMASLDNVNKMMQFSDLLIQKNIELAA